MHKTMLGLARGLAIIGGMVLTLLVVLTCLSILGRLLNGALHGDVMQGMLPGFSDWALGLGIGPIAGDFELVEAGVAFAIFCFLPLCQITGGHASVDILANRFSPRVNRVLRMLTEIAFAAVLVLIAWKLGDGMLAKKRYGETTFLLQFPIWWAYALSFAASVAAALVGLYMAVLRIRECAAGHALIPGDGETTH